ncbi:MAG: right-handed parallel beta-helix repeat-containing protein [Phycisphaerales bacterium]
MALRGGGRLLIAVGTVVVGGTGWSIWDRAASPILYVDDDAPSGGDGAAWSTAFSDLQEAIDRAEPGAEIRVAAGRYRPDRGSNEREASFGLQSGVSISGGFAGLVGDDPDERDPLRFATILTGEIGVEGIRDDNSMHVVTSGFGVDATAVLDGFIIRDGYSDRFGAGLLVHGGAPTIRRCVFEGLEAYAGAAVFNRHSDTRFESCRFEDNLAVVRGAAVYTVESSPTFVDCQFVANDSYEGGSAIYSVGGDIVITDCSFTRNRADQKGAALFNAVGQPLITNCTFDGNESAEGAAYYHDSGLGAFENCVFTANHATNRGGAVAVRNGFPTFRGCRFLSNGAVSQGGAIFNERGRFDLLDCVFSRNKADIGHAIFTDVIAVSRLKDCTIEPDDRVAFAGSGDSILLEGEDDADQ